MIRFRRSWQRKDRVNHGRTTSRNGRASRCRYCCSSRMTEVDGQSSQQMHLLECPNDAWMSRVLVYKSWVEKKVRQSCNLHKGRKGVVGLYIHYFYVNLCNVLMATLISVIGNCVFSQYVRLLFATFSSFGRLHLLIQFR